MNSKRIYQMCVSLSLVWCITACEKKKNKDTSLPVQNTFRMSIPTEPPTLDWNKATDTTSSRIIDNIMDGLIAYDFSKSDISYKMALAKSISTPDKGQTWIITLKENVYWTDGVPFNGQHIIDSWERLLNPKTASAYSYFLFPIKNAKQYNEGRIRDFSKVGIQLTTDGKLIVKLIDQRNFFPFTLTHSTTYPIRKDIIEKHQGKWTQPENIVTLGPYSIESWEHDKLIILKRNQSYYQKFSGNVENVSIKIITEPSTALNLFDANQLDYLNDLPAKQFSILKNRPDFISIPQIRTQYYGFQVTNPPMDNPKLRQAIAMAIDRKQLIKMLHHQANPLKSFIPKRVFGFESNIGLSFNPKKAKELFEQIDGTQILPKLTISYNTNEDHERIAENIQSQLKTNLGIHVELLNEEWKTYLNTVRTGHQVMIYRMGWVPDYPDPHTYMNLMTSDSENNYTKWKNQKYDQLIKSAAKLTNSQKRQALYNQAQKLLTETDAVVIPLYQPNSTVLMSKRIKSFSHNDMEKFILKDIVLN